MIKPTHKGVTAPSHYQEQNDCSVRSIANAKNITYEEAHNLLKSLGREDGCTTSGAALAAACLRSGGKLKLFQIDYIERYSSHAQNLTRYLPYLQTMNFVVIMQQHAFAVVRGNIIDNREVSENEIVLGVYEFEQRSRCG